MDIKQSLRIVRNRLFKQRINLTKLLNLSDINKLEDKILDNSLLGNETKIEIVIFSKDRPLQLHSLITSLIDNSNIKLHPHIIYSAEDSDYEKAYRELFEDSNIEFGEVINESQDGFRKSLIDLLDRLDSEKITFFVDDIIITGNIDWNKLSRFDCSKVVPSLRLNENLERCYTVNDIQQKPPMKRSEGLIWWVWKEGDYDWGYPLSVDGNVFDLKEIREIIKNTNFKAPNTLELNLQQYKHRFSNRLGCCFVDSKIVNIPVNRVQNEIANIHGNIHQNELLKYWNEGKRIDFKAYAGFKNISAHQELDLVFKE